MIRRSLKRLIHWAQAYGGGSLLIDNSPTIGKIGSDNGMSFTLYSASGGYVVELKQYDRKTDRYDNKLHIINSDENLGERIGHIITLELLRA